ncbi:MAG TPA: LytTR family DNA-binding domain-containing protein [Steroidobacteraceae bacterium]|jgi:two-component system LytT family response regulator|nr:LytTR family DNA-binding domain-containing protein [Steroidobacteraceae bacterium]
MDVMIVDDEPGARRTLRECCAREPDLHLIGEFGDSAGALQAIRATPPHLLFLDIQIDSLTGLQLARALDPETLPLIVFVTAYDTYALEAFEVSAVDYLLKPFDDERFRRTLARVRARQDAASASGRQRALEQVLAQLERNTRTSSDPRPRILAESGSRMHMLDAAQVEVAESDRNYVKLIVGREVYLTRSTLQQAERALQSQSTLRISRSCVVNTSHVREISRTPRGDFILVMAGGTTVTSSEGFREAVRDYLARLKLG